MDTVIATAGSGQGRIPTGTQKTAVQDFADTIRPTDNEQYNVLLPEMPTAKKLTIKIRAICATGYKWDWDSTAGSWAVAAYSAIAPSLTLDTPAPQDLIDAVTLGFQPRIQVLSTTAGAPVIPDQVRVTAIDGTNLILTLSAALSVDPTVGDAVIGGSYVAPSWPRRRLTTWTALGLRGSPGSPI